MHFLEPFSMRRDDDQFRRGEEESSLALWPLVEQTCTTLQSMSSFAHAMSLTLFPVHTCRDDDELSAEQRQSLVWRFERALAAGSANAHGGATDAAVRLSHLLKVLPIKCSTISFFSKLELAQ